MFPKPAEKLTPNTAEFEVTPLTAPTGFREYDARWVFNDDVNLMGIQALGMGIATQMQELGLRPAIAVGHDYRSYKYFFPISHRIIIFIVNLLST